MGNEFHERFLHELRFLGVRVGDVAEGEHREHAHELQHSHQLAQGGESSESRQAVVPNGPQELLDIRMSYELKSENKINERTFSRKLSWTAARIPVA